MRSSEAPALPFPLPKAAPSTARPVPRQEGARPPRGTLVAALRQAATRGDTAAEHDAARMLSHLCLTRGVHVGDAVSVMLRALELTGDDETQRAVRREAAAHLAALGRHDEASDLLRAGLTDDPNGDFEAGLAAADAAARSGDASGAAVIYRELALGALDDVRPLERLATIAAWSAGSLTPDRASDVWLEAAARTTALDGKLLCVARAFESCPGNRRATDAFVENLTRQHRHEAADEVLREHGHASASTAAVAEERFHRARANRSWAAALGAALDMVAHGGPRLELVESLRHLARDAGLAPSSDVADADIDRVVRELLDAAAIEESGVRAEALVRASESLRGPARAACLALAAEAYHDGGNLARCRKVILQARASAPLGARACTALFVLARSEEVETRDLEDALAILPARAEHYRTLARQCARAGRHLLGGSWLRRALALRPGDAELRQRLLSILAASSTTLPLDLVGATLVEVAAAPYPLGDVAVGLGRALDALAERDPKRTALIGRSLLQLTGPIDEVVEATVRAASISGEESRALDALVLHAVVGGSERIDRWFRAIDVALVTDVEAAAAHLSQAATLVTDGHDLRPRIEAATAGLSNLLDGARSDARLDLATARAWLAELEGPPEVAADRWRDLGALRWDLARDPIGAEEAYFYACAKTPERGVFRYVEDLLDRGGLDETLERVQARVMLLDEGEEGGLAAALLAAVAAVGLEHGREDLASELAYAALSRTTPRLDALAVLEAIVRRRADDGARDEAVALLMRCYETAARTAAGRHGARSAWHRGARLLEALGEPSRALGFAVEAVMALPIDGAPVNLVRRLLRALAARDGRAAAEAHAATLLGRLRTVGESPHHELRDPRRARREERGLRLLTAALSLEWSAPPVDEGHRDSPFVDREPSDDEGEASTRLGDSRAFSAVQERLPREPSEPNAWELSASAELTLSEQALAQAESYAELVGCLMQEDDEPASSSRRRHSRALRRLRAAAVLERHLDDLPGACIALEGYLNELGGVDVEAERQLARWYERCGRTREAAERWERVLGLAPDLDRKVQAAVRACDAFLEAGDSARAAACLDRVAHAPPTTELTLLKLALTASDDTDDSTFDDIGYRESLEGSTGVAEFEPATEVELRAFGIQGAPPYGNVDEVNAIAAAAPRGPDLDSVDRDELSILEEELDEGVYEAGELLASIYGERPERFGPALVSVRRRQCRLRPGDVASVGRLLDALRRHGLPWEVDAARQVQQVLVGEPANAPPPLEVLVESREAVFHLVFGHLAGTINDALAVAWRGGVLRGQRRSEVPDGLAPVAMNDGTDAGRLQGALLRLVPLEGARLYRRSALGPLDVRMSLRAPFGAVLEGVEDGSSHDVAYVVGSALASSTAPCAFAEGLDQDDLDVLVRTFLTAFGPVPQDEAVGLRDAMSAQLVQELWAAARGADERKVRELCYDPSRVSAGIARHLSARARRRLGLFACGDLHTAIRRTAAELGIGPHDASRDPETVRELCTHPSIANLIELALDPAYAECRWRRGTPPVVISGERAAVS
jgi:hypothetical protein